MTLRLVLVGLVAGLGLTMPSRRDLDTWENAAQRWVSARLAEWDASGEVGEDSCVFIAELPEPVAVAPPASDEEFKAVLDEIVDTFAQDGATDATRDAGAVATKRVTAGDTPASTADGLTIPPPEAPAAVVAEATPEDERESGERSDLVMQEIASHDSAKPAPSPSASRDAAFESVVEEMASGFAADLVAMAERGGNAATPGPRFEPIEVADDLQSDPAYALNRASEGLDVTGLASSPPPSVTESRLTNAVRLTREAVFAWTSLLHGPAVMTISR